MRLVAFLVVILLLLVIGGALTTQITGNDNNPAVMLPFLKQTDDPDASVFESIPWKSEQFFLLVGFVLFNLIGMGATVALVMWLLDAQVRRAKSQETEGGRMTVAKDENAAEAG